MKYVVIIAFFLFPGCEETATSCVDDSENRLSEPSLSCVDFDPCTVDTYTANGGCSHERAIDGVQCFDDNGTVGACNAGLCVVTKDEFVDTICTQASHGCAGYDPYIVNRLSGTCLVEWCNFDAPGRSLQPKPSGSPCVRPFNEGSPEFTVSQCNSCGECM